MRKTHSLVQVVTALLNDPRGRHWGYDLTRQSGVRSGVLYPMLARMLDEGWLIDGWEDAPTHGRPPRRYYELTNQGRNVLTALLAEARHDPRFAALLAERGRR